MKLNRPLPASLALVAAILVGTIAIAQQANDIKPAAPGAARAPRLANRAPGATPAATTDTNTTEGNLGKLDNKTTGGTIRSSQLVGANIKNSAGDAVGEINDLVIDRSGKIRYAAITYGGFLGMGSKMFAVPFEAFKVSQNPNDPNDRDDYVLTLDVTKEQLNGAQGFDKDRWPNFADTTFTQELDRRYNVHRTPTHTGAEPTR